MKTLFLRVTVGTMALFSVPANAAEAHDSFGDPLGKALILFGCVVAGAGVLMRWMKMK